MAPGPHGSRELGTIAKSPLDPNKYKLIQLCSNGLKALLVSTSHDRFKIQRSKLDPVTCSFEEVKDFNAKYLKINPKDSNIKIANDTPTSKSSSSTETNKIAERANHDQNAGQVTVALTVGAGWAHDPSDIPGMAHFLEHCMFLGSEKYPELNGFNEFIESHNGHANASTGDEKTVFHFTVDVGGIEKALAMLADFIKKPILDQTRIEEEIEAIESEFIMSKLKDHFRLRAILKSLATADHPMSKLGVGCRKTLSNIGDLKEQVVNWKGKHYLAGNMAFAIRGELNFEYLEELVVKFFSSIPHCNCRLPERKTFFNKFKEVEPFDPVRFSRFIYITPVMDNKWMQFTWILSPQAEVSYKTKPKDLLMYLFLSKVEGSLDHYLRTKGWLITICNNCANWSTRFCSMFSLNLELTENGLKNRSDVIKATFSYIKMLQTSKTEELRRIFDEIKQVNADKFHYTSDANLRNPVDDFLAFPTYFVLQELAEMVLHEVEPRDILLSKIVTVDFDEPLIRDCLAKLNPRNFNLIIASRSLEHLCTSREEMYNIKYSIRNFKESFLSLLEKMPPSSDFYLPPPNKFVSVNFCFPSDPKKRFQFKKDSVVLDKDKANVAYYNMWCERGQLPSAIYEMDLTSPKVADKLENVRMMPLLKVWTRCLSYLIDFKLATALNSLISYDVGFAGAILYLDVRGPSEKLPELFEVIVNTFMNFEKEISLSIFKNMAESQINAYNNFSMKGLDYASELKNYVLSHRVSLTAEWSKLLSETTFSKFLGFVEAFKDKMYINVSMLGCVSKSEAAKVTEMVNRMEYSPWSNRHILSKGYSLNRAIKLPVGERCFRVKAKNKFENSHWIVNHYQIGHVNEASKEEIMIENMLAPAMHSSCFEQLRSKEHLAYYVRFKTETYHSVCGFTVVVCPPAENFTPDYVDERIDKFIFNFYKNVIRDKENYQKRIDPDNFFFREEGISWKNVKEFYEKYLLRSGKQFKKLSIQVVGFPNTDSAVLADPIKGNFTQWKVNKYSSRINMRNRDIDSRNELLPYDLDIPKEVKEENGYFITDLRRFKSSQHFYANLSGWD